MIYKLIIRKRAEKQLEKAFDWYELQRPALGNEFLLSVDAALALIVRNPQLFQKRYKEIRFALIHRFPYGVFYLIDEDKIIVFAFFHLSRNPKRWKELKNK